MRFVIGHMRSHTHTLVKGMSLASIVHTAKGRGCFAVSLFALPNPLSNFMLCCLLFPLAPPAPSSKHYNYIRCSGNSQCFPCVAVEMCLVLERVTVATGQAVTDEQFT